MLLEDKRLPGKCSPGKRWRPRRLHLASFLIALAAWHGSGQSAVLFASSSAEAVVAQLEPQSIGQELERLAKLLEAPELGQRAERFKALHAEAVAALEAGRLRWALQRLVTVRVTAGAFGYMQSQAESVPDVASFERLWRRSAAMLEQAEDSERLGACDVATAQLRAIVEAASNRAIRLYHAALAIAEANDQASGGLFYLGRAQGELDLVSLCRTLVTTDQVDVPESGWTMDSVSASLRGLRQSVASAYAKGDAAIEQHSRFIQLNAGLKELRELEAAGLAYGALDTALASTLHLSEIEQSESIDTDLVQSRLAEQEQQLAKLPGDHSIAWAYLEGAKASVDQGEEELGSAAAVARAVLPAYFQLLSAAQTTDRAAVVTEESPVTVTLLRWPYT